MSFDEDPRDNDEHAECSAEIHRLETEIARLTGELQAYRILDAAGRINREETQGS